MHKLDTIETVNFASHLKTFEILAIEAQMANPGFLRNATKGRHPPTPDLACVGGRDQVSIGGDHVIQEEEYMIPG